MASFTDPIWIAETKRLFEALVVETQMMLNDTKALYLRVAQACDEGGVEPPIDVPPAAYVPPVISVAARASSVREH